jgi:hypothetical protein
MGRRIAWLRASRLRLVSVATSPSIAPRAARAANNDFPPRARGDAEMPLVNRSVQHFRALFRSEKPSLYRGIDRVRSNNPRLGLYSVAFVAISAAPEHFFGNRQFVARPRSKLAAIHLNVVQPSLGCRSTRIDKGRGRP